MQTERAFNEAREAERESEMLKRTRQIARQPGVDFNSLAMGGSSAMEMGKAKTAAADKIVLRTFVVFFLPFLFCPKSQGFISL